MLCDAALLVVQEDMPFSANGQEVLRRLSPFLREAGQSAEWPGTKLLGRKGQVYHYNLVPECAGILEASVDSLYDWLQPERPEDLCFLRPDGSALLTSIAHERDYFLSLSDADISRIRRECPDLYALLVPEPTRIE